MRGTCRGNTGKSWKSGEWFRWSCCRCGMQSSNLRGWVVLPMAGPITRGLLCWKEVELEERRKYYTLEQGTMWKTCVKLFSGFRALSVHINLELAVSNRQRHLKDHTQDERTKKERFISFPPLCSQGDPGERSQGLKTQSIVRIRLLKVLPGGQHPVVLQAGPWFLSVLTWHSSTYCLSSIIKL